MEVTLGDLPFCVYYVYDILISSASKEGHLQHLQIVLQCLQENSLIVQYEKCSFATKRVEFLGHLITPEGIQPLPEKVAAIRKFPTLTTVKGLQEFLRMVTFYHLSLPDIALTLAPLYKDLKGNSTRQRQTDHLLLVHSINRQSDAWSPHQGCQLSAIAEFNCTLCHIPRKHNPVAGTLSRISIDAVHLGLDYKQLAANQQQDPELNVSTLLKKPFILHSIWKDAMSWARDCSSWQLSKIQHHTNSGVGSFHRLQRHLAHVHIGIVGTPLCSEGHQYLLTMVNHLKRCPEAAPMKEASVAACASAFLSSWVSRFSIPNHNL
ncbi:uncharacterized protein [Macrobrachium rosenbergii]|uniref:uncharacterized protein n=1 Tax=Macrobrachium rosenbergii TaxID=79674 RepID=UPI0034D52405